MGFWDFKIKFGYRDKIKQNEMKQKQTKLLARHHPDPGTLAAKSAEKQPDNFIKINFS